MKPADRTSNPKGRRGRRERDQQRVPAFRKSPSEKPRTVDHWCSRTQMIRRGDERDCRVCRAVAFVSSEQIEEARRAERRQSRESTTGAGAREMGKYDAAGKPWGYRSAGYFPGIGKGSKKR